MYRLMSAFIYERGETFLHTIDPRAKLAWVAVFFASSVMSNLIIFQLLVLLIHSLMALLAKNLRRWLRSLLSVAPFFLFILVVTYLITQNPMRSILPSVRLLALVGIFSIFFMSTPPETFGLMLEKLGLPQTVSLAFSMALRFIPVLAQQSQDVIDAQKSRGLSVDARNPLKKLRSLIPIFIPIIVLSIKRSIEVAEALEVRAFDLSRKRTSLVDLRMGRGDFLFLTVVALFLGVFLLLYFNGLL